MSQTPRLRTSNDYVHPLNEIPRKVIVEISKRIAFLEYVGEEDITGDRWAFIFSEAVGGTYKKSMTELPDVTKNSTFWSAKTIRPVDTWNTSKDAVIISGRNNLHTAYPDLPQNYDYFADPKKTGDLILGIWNARVKNAKEKFADARECVLIRNANLDNFILYEKELVEFNPQDYTWKKNNRGNLWGFDAQGNNRFRWQVSTQFTIVEPLPNKYFYFSLPKHGKRISLKDVLGLIDFSANAVEIKTILNEDANESEET